ncbi:MAG: FAD-dependent oxidoreductase, partial [Bacteroidota bacterium]
MELSYWEIKSWLSNIDFTIVGSGIVGLNCALELRKKYPKSKILILEKGILPQGASTKNAGFACFGSLSEILEDLKSHSDEEVLQLIQQRIEGLRLLRENLGDDTIDYQEHGGYELFLNQDQELFEACIERLPEVNKLLLPLFGTPVFSTIENLFNFKDILERFTFNRFEGQIDTGKMITGLLQKAYNQDIRILNSCELKAYSEDGHQVYLQTNHFEFSTKQLLIATNGFVKQLLEEKVKPARAQVLITKPIPNLKIKGTFHLDKGYYYFRNIEDRILFGGGRNLDFQAEETTEFGETTIVQERLEQLLRNTILPNTDFSIEHRWSGIMGVGTQKKPIIK